MHQKERKFEVESEFAKAQRRSHCFFTVFKILEVLRASLFSLFILLVIRQGRCSGIFEGGVWGFW